MIVYRVNIMESAEFGRTTIYESKKEALRIAALLAKRFNIKECYPSKGLHNGTAIWQDGEVRFPHVSIIKHFVVPFTNV